MSLKLSGHRNGRQYKAYSYRQDAGGAGVGVGAAFERFVKDKASVHGLPGYIVVRRLQMVHAVPGYNKM